MQYYYNYAKNCKIVFIIIFILRDYLFVCFNTTKEEKFIINV